MKKRWWHDAVVYEIYCKSFCDSNGDGIGDLPGVISKLPELKELGINTIWFTPIYTSPQVDNGYDVADYKAIDPAYGTLEDFKQLLDIAHSMGIRIIMDLVLNHCSDQHHWFKEALKGGDNPYRDYFIWRDGDSDTCPNEMRSVFGGPAWTYVPELGQYYFHQFAVEQPDLNWENPTMRRALYDFYASLE